MAQEGFKRKLTAILSADVAGYSRLMGEDETATVKTLSTYREIMTTLIQQHRGRVVDSPGDNMLAEFASVVDAVQCGVALQKELQARNAELPENKRMEFRIGINLGDVIEEGDRIYGDGVNVAARLEGLADSGGICVSKTAFDQIESKLPLGYEFLGDQTVKNIAKPVGAYRVLMEPRVTVAGADEGKEAKLVIRYRAVLIGGIAVCLVGVILAIWHYYFLPSIEPASVEKMIHPLPDRPSIAVLPFENLSGDPEQEYFSDGLTKEIITALSKTPKLFVIARNSVFTYKGKPVRIQDVSEELGVRYVLEGSIRKDGKRLRINVQLIDAIAGRNIWAERYERELQDLFPLQDEITKKILTGLHIKLTEGEHTRLWAKGTDSIEAYLKCLQGREYILRASQDGIILGRQSLEEAIGLDPEYGMAYTFMGWSYLQEVSGGWSKSRKNDLSRAYEMAQKALTLDAPKEDVYALLSGIHLRKGKIEKTIVLREKAVSLNPNHAVNNALLATAMTFGGRTEEAIEIFKKALRLDPIPPLWFLHYFGHAYRVLGEYGKAIAMFKTVITRDPNYWLSHWGLAVCYGLLGHEEEAKASADEVLRIRPKFNLSKVMGFPYKDKADRKRCFEVLRNAGLPDKPPPPLPDKPSIAVLPFNNMSDEPKQEYFSDGITENIIMALSKTPKLFVIARNSTFVYKDKPFNIKQAAEELGVRYILEGSVQKTENRVRITAQLIDSATGRHQWAERYDRELKDIFALQDEITLEIITALQVELTEGEQSRIHRGSTTNLEAFLKILKGREHHFRFTREDMEIAKRMYKEAIALDPRYDTAYFWLGYAIDAELTIGWSKSRIKDIEHLFELSEKILALNDSSAQAHIVLSRYYAYTGQPDRAIKEAEKAVDLNPNDADGYAFGGLALNQTGRYREATLWFKKAIRRNPSPPTWYLSQLDVSYIGMGKYEDAIPNLKKAINKAPNAGTHALYCHTLSMLGKHEEALGIMKKAILRLESQYYQNMKLSHIAEYYRRTGRYEQAIDTSRELLDSNPDNNHVLRAYITLTCTFSAKGSEEDALKTATEVLRIIPDFSIDALTKKDSYSGLSFYDWFQKDETDKNLLVTTLRKAGLK